MALIIFAGTYLTAAIILGVVTGLARGERARAFKGLSPGMLPPLGIIFGLLVGFIAAQVWSDFEKAKIAVVTEASALRTIVLLSEAFPEDQQAQIRSRIREHIDIAVSQEWPAMSRQKASLASFPASCSRPLKRRCPCRQLMTDKNWLRGRSSPIWSRPSTPAASASSPANRRVSRLKWAGLLLQGLCTLVAIAMVHSDNRTTCAIALTLFATGIAMSILLIGCYSRPFTGEISVGHELLDQVMTAQGPGR